MTGLSSSAKQLSERLDSREACIAVVGLGYVGLPLAGVMHDAGFQVLGFDRDGTKITKLKTGEAYLKHLGEDLTRTLAASENFTPTEDPGLLAQADAVLLCVPSPLGRHREPDLSYIIDTTRMVARALQPGQLIVLESTTYPGTTREKCLPILRSSGLECGTDFFLAFSPEREDPGRKDLNTRSIPKVVGGTDPVSTMLAAKMYGAAVEHVVAVDSAEIAEAAKLLENIYRAVNIALVNELKPVLHAMDIDIWKVIEAADTKPFGFHAFYPGPGLGGHCIPIDPFYLTWRAREFGHHTRFIELAGEVNSGMPRYVISRTTEGLNRVGKAIRGSHILVCGIAYKPDIDDVRETPAAEIIQRLADLGAEVSYHDPHVPHFPRMRKYEFRMDSVDVTKELLDECDCVLIVTHHEAIDWQLIAQEAKLIVDTRNVMADMDIGKGIVVRA
ncbi:MAG: nucleotide sugar dehydrogenase [Planctomycetota bacterium]|jgi:UDP-N-acetyl-D-glucosamine dehydrogenase